MGQRSSAGNRIDDGNVFAHSDWLEVGQIELGPVYVDIGSSMDHCRVDLASLQNSFLKLHDNRTRRLWFLWDPLGDAEAETAGPSHQPSCAARCGCRGGCTFFGVNFNGCRFFDCDEAGCYAPFANPNRPCSDPAFGQSILRDNSFFLEPLDDQTPNLSAASDLSTVKQSDEVFVDTGSLLANSTTARDGLLAEENAALSVTRKRRSLHSLHGSGESELKRQSFFAASSPVLLPSPEKKKTVRSNNCNTLSDGPTGNNSSRISGLESPSEMYFSAEEEDKSASSSSDELVSLSSHLAGDVAIGGSPLREGGGGQASFRSGSTSSSPSSSLLTSRTTSNLSFNSAVSSTADFSVVDLHLQTARPVVDSPILLASYMTHLGEADCRNWCSPVPKSPSEIKSRMEPQFVLTKKGFTSYRLVDRPPQTATSSNTKHFAFPAQPTEEKTTNFWEGIQDEKNGMRNDATTFFVKIDRSIDIMFSPLTLESAQRFAEAFVPTLEHIHPLTVMSRIHRQCISHVESQNPLKMGRTSLLESKEPKEAAYKDVIHYNVRGSLQIPRINLCLLQAGIIEQIISLSALDNPRDLVCVSTAAICIDGLALNFSKSVQEKRIVKAVSRPPTETQLTKKTKSKSRQGNSIATEVVFVESSITDNEHLMVSGTLGKIHLQLRRLNNDINLQSPESVTATVIPASCSRVLFNFSCAQSAKIEHQEEARLNEKTSDNNDQDRFGIVMFECGIQGLSLRALKRVSNSEDKAKGAAVELETNAAHRQETPLTATDKMFTENEQLGAQQAGPASSQRGKPSVSASVNDPKDVEQLPADDRDVSSCSLQIRSVWLSFAAPPRSTSTKKSDLTFLDRNLLSTASPAINAWMNSGDRLALTVSQLRRVAESRVMSVLAGLMVEALDVQPIHLHTKSKYNCLSLMARTLQEDPSCQLNVVLHRYVLLQQNDWALLETRLSPAVVPPLPTLKQGIIFFILKNK